MESIIENLQSGDSLGIIAYDNIKIKKNKDEEVLRIKSPFDSNKQYEDYMKSYFGTFTTPTKSILDKINKIHIVCVHKDFSEKSNYLMLIRKL